MEVKANEYIILRNPFMVDVATRNIENEAYLHAFEQNALAFTQVANNFMCNFSSDEKNKVEKSKIIDMLTALKKEQKKMYDGLQQEMINALTNTQSLAGGISSKVDDINLKIDSALEEIINCNDNVVDTNGMVNTHCVDMKNKLDMVNTHYVDTKNRLDAVNTHCVDTKNKIDNGFAKSASKIDEVMKNKVTELNTIVADKMSNLIQIMNSSIATTLDKLNVDTISRTLGKSVADVMEATSQSQAMSLIETMKNDTRDMLVAPILETNKALLDNIKSLPQFITANNTGFQTQLVQVNGLCQQNISKLADMEKDVTDFVSRTIDSKAVSQNQVLACIPDLTKNALNDVMTAIQLEVNKTNTLMQSLQKQCDSIKEDVYKTRTNDEIQSQKVKSIKTSGTECEDMLIELLCEQLLSRDGYMVEKVAGLAQSCDINVKKEGGPDIRIECKAHTDRVRGKEVEKFKRDLLQTNNHGILVSLKSGICGMKNYFELQHLRNGKFAVFLSNNEYDADTIVQMIILLHKLDSIVKMRDGGDGGFVLSQDTLARVQALVRDGVQKLVSMKLHLKQCLGILDELHFETLESMILGDGAQEELACKGCKKIFKSSKGLIGHEKKCKAVIEDCGGEEGDE